MDRFANKNSNTATRGVDRFATSAVKSTSSTVNPKIAQYQAEDKVFKSESEKVNSFWGLVKNTITGIPSTLYNNRTLIKDTITGIPKASVDVAKNLYTGIKEPLTNPNEQQKQYEAKYFPEQPKGIIRTLTTPGVTAARYITRFLSPALQPLANDIAEIKAINEKGGIADQVASGRVPAAVFDEFAVLHKSSPQIVGDVAQAVLSAYAGGEGEKLLAGTVKQTLKQTLIKGATSGLATGELFGVAQAASSGSTNPLEILGTVGTSGVAGGALGLITSGAVPVTKKIFKEVVKAKNIYDALPANQKQGGFAKNPFFREELNPLAQKAKEMSKDDFVNQFNKGLEAQSLTVRDTAKNVKKLMEEDGIKTPEQFYDLVTDQKTSQTLGQDRLAQGGEEAISGRYSSEQKNLEQKPLSTEVARETPAQIVEKSALKETIPQDFNPVKYIDEQIIKREKARVSEKPTLKGKIIDFLANAKKKLVDFSAPIEDVLNETVKKNDIKLLPSENIHNQIDRVLRAPTIAGEFARANGLYNIIQKVDNINHLDQYLIAKHAIELDTRGITTGRDIAKDTALVKALKDKYEAQAEQVSAYSRKLLDYTVSSGLISKELAEMLKKRYPDYVPFNRIFNELEKSGYESGQGGVASLSKQSIVQKIEGSTREVESPLESLLAKTNDAFKQGEKNKAGKMLASYEKLPGNPFKLKALRITKNVLERIKILTKIKEINTKLKPLFRELKQTFKGDKSILSYIGKLEKEFSDVAGMQAEELYKFFNEGEKTSKTTATSRKLGVIPDALQSFANDIKSAKDFSIFIKTKEGLKLEKAFEDGILERNGFSSMEKFFDTVKDPYKAAGEKTIEVEGKQPAEEFKIDGDKITKTKNGKKVTRNMDDIEKKLYDVKVTKESLPLKYRIMEGVNPKPTKVTVKELDLLKQKFFNFNKGYKLAVKDIAESQSKIIKVIKDNFPVKERGQFITAIKNATTKEKIITLIDNLKSKYEDSIVKQGEAEASQQAYKLVNLQKKIEQLIEKSKTLSEIDKKSIDDSFIYLEKNISDLKFTKEDLLDELSLTKQAEADGKSTISFYDEGIKNIYETTKEVAQAAKSLNVQQLNILGKIFALPVRIARVGITGINPTFILRNLSKDNLTAFINSDHSLATSIANPSNFLKGLFSAVKHDKLYHEILAEGGGGTSFDISRNQVAKTVKEIRADKSVVSKILYVVKNPSQLLRAVENIVAIAEETTRIQQYRGTKNALIKKGVNEAEAKIAGARAYRENTVNFARRGEWGTVLNSTFLYLNAGIQGTRTLLRNLKEKPVATTTKIVIGAFTPVALVTAWNLSDPKRKEAYEDIAEYEKENNIIIIPPNPTKDANGKWNIIKIPLSQEIVNLVGLVRRPIEAANGLNPLEFKDFANAIIGTIEPIQPTKGAILSTLTPQAIKPTIEVAVNKVLFTGFPIVPQSMEKLSPENQVKDKTSGSARKIAKLLNVSPLKVEVFIRETFGGVGSQAENAIDQVLAELKWIPKEQIGGQDVLDSIAAAFTKGAGGETEQKELDEIQSLLTKQADAGLKIKQEAETKWIELKAMPKEQAALEFEKLSPELQNKISDIASNEAKGLTLTDRFIAQLQVENGERAKYIAEKFNSLKTNEEKAKLWEEYISKGLISANVAEQLSTLLNK